MAQIIGLVNRKFSYLLTMILSVFVLIILICKLQLYPLGDHYLRYMDADQYFGFYGYLQNSFFSKSNLIYSWSTILGDCMLSTYAYYASSPFNLLLFFFKNDLPLGMMVIYCIRTVFTALCFCYFLESVTDDHNNLEKGIFSTAYAFMGYTVFFAWNGSWMDSVAILPLMITGLKRLVRDRKNFLYVLSLGISLISNFYTGYMLCVTSIIFYLLFCIDSDLNAGKFLDNFKKSFVFYTFSSILSAGLSMCLILPVVFQVPGNRMVNPFKHLTDISSNFNPVDFLSMFYSCFALYDPLNLPVIFVGIVPFVLILLYFLNKNIKFSDKLIAFLLLMFFFISFFVSLFNMMWHDMSFNVCFNYRYSFIFSFIILTIAYKSLSSCSLEIHPYIISGGVFFLVTILVFFCSTEKANIETANIVMDLIIGLVGLILILSIKRCPQKMVFRSALLLLMLFNIIHNSIYIMSKGTEQTSVKDYFDHLHAINEVKSLYDDNTFTRIANCFSFGSCDSCDFDYAGTAYSASTIRPDVLEYSPRFGLFCNNWNSVQYSTNTPKSTEDLFGFRYILSETELPKQYSSTKNTSENKTIYENNDALPLFFITNSLFEKDSSKNYFEYQNNLFNSFVKQKSQTPIFEESDYSLVLDGSKKQISEIQISCDPSETVYLQRTFDHEMKADIIGSNVKNTLMISPYNEVYCLGHTENDGITIRFDSPIDLGTDMYIYKQNESVLSGYIEDIRKFPQIDARVISSSHLEFDTDNSEDHIIATTIPYDKDWRIYIDGSSTKTIKNAGFFESFIIPGGKHHIELLYRPRGFYIGLVISVLSLLLLICQNYGRGKNIFILGKSHDVV